MFKNKTNSITGSPNTRGKIDQLCLLPSIHYRLWVFGSFGKSNGNTCIENSVCKRKIYLKLTLPNNKAFPTHRLFKRFDWSNFWVQIFSYNFYPMIARQFIITRLQPKFMK